MDFNATEIAKSIVAEHGYKRAADVLFALIEEIDNDLVHLVAGDENETAEGSIEYGNALYAVEDYLAYVQEDVHPRYDAGLIPEPLSAQQLGVVK